MLNRIITTALISALAFGQVGAGFLHNKHEAHETVREFSHDLPVLINHGEHCKVCAVDWIHQFVTSFYSFDLVKVDFDFLTPDDDTLAGNFILVLKSNKAPPVLG